jgi:hypothetical protein
MFFLTNYRRLFMGIIMAIIGWTLLILVGGFALFVVLLALGRQSHDGMSFLERLAADPEESHRRRQAYRLNATLFWLFGVPAIMFGGIWLFFQMLFLLGRL